MSIYIKSKCESCDKRRKLYSHWDFNSGLWMLCHECLKVFRKVNHPADCSNYKDNEVIKIK